MSSNSCSFEQSFFLFTYSMDSWIPMACIVYFFLFRQKYRIAFHCLSFLSHYIILMIFDKFDQIVLSCLTNLIKLQFIDRLLNADMTWHVLSFFPYYKMMMWHDTSSLKIFILISNDEMTCHDIIFADMIMMT